MGQRKQKYGGEGSAYNIGAEAGMSLGKGAVLVIRESWADLAHMYANTARSNPDTQWIGCGSMGNVVQGFDPGTSESTSFAYTCLSNKLPMGNRAFSTPQNAPGELGKHARIYCCVFQSSSRICPRNLKLVVEETPSGHL